MCMYIYIQKRQLNWFEHTTRLPYNIRAGLALHHTLKPTIRLRGQQKITWILMTKKRFQEYNLKWEEAYDIATKKIEIFFFFIL